MSLTNQTILIKCHVLDYESTSSDLWQKVDVKDSDDVICLIVDDLTRNAKINVNI